MWTCSRCGARVEPSFEVCWRCGTSYQGVEDPDFVSADDAPPVDDPAGYLRLDAGKPAEAELPEPPMDLVPCFGSNELAEAAFVVNELASEGVPATLQNSHHGGVGLPRHVFSRYPCLVVVRAEDLPRAQLWVKAYQARQEARDHLHG